MYCCLDYYNFCCCPPRAQNFVLDCLEDATKINRYSSQHQLEYQYGVGLLPVER